MDLTPDTTKLTAEQRDKLDLYNMSKSQGDALKALEQKMSNFTPEMQMKISNLADLKQDLTPILDALKALEAKEQPDTTSTIVDAVGKLEKALGAIDFKPNFKPEVKVGAPQVNISAPKVNLTGVEKAVKDVSSAVKEAIAQIPTVDVPETDFTPLLDKLDVILKQLADIDTGVRLKPEPGTMKVTNTDGSSINSTTIQGVVSAKNSSTVNLAANGVFTGVGELVKDYASVQVAVYSNQASATDGLSIQQSMDGANWDITDVYTIAASTGKTFSVQPASEYLRIVYTNGASAQGSFRLATIYHTVAPKPSSQRPVDAVSNENDLEQTQSFGMAYNGATWDRVRGTTANGIAVDVTRITGTVVVDDLAAAPTGSAVPSNAQYQGNIAKIALPTAASDGNLTGNMSDKYGRSVVIPGMIRDLVGTQTTTISASTAETTIVAQAGSIFNDITTLIVSNTSATAARVDFRDTTAGTILFSLYIPAGDMRGVSPTRPLPQTTVNTNWTAQSSASVTDLRVYAVFDKNK